ncbi:MAG: hypothetical protein NCW75_14535 [Phycisphaera sp.]|nr:MAG: hypothetical protein NCW75_14535 [Phycisphaera sp.]
MARTPHRLLHLVEADHPAMPPPEADAPVDMIERGGDLSALACAAMLDAEETNESAHAVVALGPSTVQRRAAALGADPVARVPVPFGTPHATANGLRKVVRNCGVRFDACIAWSAFAARVARLTGFGPGRGDLAPLLEADPHRPDPESSKLELLRGERADAGALGSLADRVFHAALAPARLPLGGASDSDDPRTVRIALLADPAASGLATLAWRGAVLAAAASGPTTLILPAGCAGARRVARLPAAANMTVAFDAGGLPQRLARSHAALAVYGPQPHQHASPGLVAYALAMGVPVVADPARLTEGHPDLEAGIATPGVHGVHAPVAIEMSRALLAAMDAAPTTI